MPTERLVTWICHPDDYLPEYVDKIIAQMTERWAEPCARHGFRFRFVMANELVPASTDRPRLWHDGVDLLETRQAYIVDDVSGDPQATHFLRGIYRTIEASDSVLLNRSLVGPECLERDKLAILAHATTLGIRTPRTVALPFGRYARKGLDVVRKEIGEGPYILKAREMGVGFGVLKLDGYEQLRAAVDIVSQTGQSYIVQEYLPNTGDLRVAMVEGKFAASMLRRPAEGAYLANITQGGSASANPDVAAVLGDVERIVADLRAGYLCVDWLLTEDGPVLGEWGTAMAEFSSMPEPARSQLADAFFPWVERLLYEEGAAAGTLAARAPEARIPEAGARVASGEGQ
ncbi:RimK family alpha-L-glutamate ligase [Streptomyces sp. NPDC056244]|uniref:ATP-grasp domain-containing protein n=1 Tax=Streptomyces sp. NPDC056244 TaxID=3345762 RepID=UPI0035DD91D7